MKSDSNRLNSSKYFQKKNLVRSYIQHKRGKLLISYRVQRGTAHQIRSQNGDFGERKNQISDKGRSIKPGFLGDVERRIIETFPGFDQTRLFQELNNFTNQKENTDDFDIQESFENFQRQVARRPRPNYTIERASEPVGLLPRSIIRTTKRFRDQVVGNDNYIQDYYLAREQLRCCYQVVIAFVVVPIFMHAVVSTTIINPTVTYLWNSGQDQIFLNQTQQERALRDFENTEAIRFFDELIGQPEVELESKLQNKQDKKFEQVALEERILPINVEKQLDKEQVNISKVDTYKQVYITIAEEYNVESIDAICNVISDFCTVSLWLYLLYYLRPQLIVFKAVIIETFFGISDTARAFMMILFSDLFVGFHSSKAWEIFLSHLFEYLGLPEDENFIYLFVATLPVFLDTSFKYFVFRYLNRISPSTVATYYSMLE